MADGGTGSDKGIDRDFMNFLLETNGHRPLDGFPKAAVPVSATAAPVAPVDQVEAVLKPYTIYDEDASSDHIAHDLSLGNRGRALLGDLQELIEATHGNPEARSKIFDVIAQSSHLSDGVQKLLEIDTTQNIGFKGAHNAWKFHILDLQHLYATSSALGLDHGKT